jgi:Flp pilus assembly protein protease CpaA
MHTAANMLVAAALVVTFVAAIFDWRKGTIPDWISLPAMPAAPVLSAVAMQRLRPPLTMPGWSFGAVTSIAGALLCALVPYLLFRFKVLGGGDVKLLATVGALLGPHSGLAAELAALAMASVYAPARLAFQGRLFATVYQSAAAAIAPLLPRVRRQAAPDAMFEGIRLSPFIFAGTVASLVSSMFSARYLP